MAIKKKLKVHQVQPIFYENEYKKAFEDRFVEKIRFEKDECIYSKSKAVRQVNTKPFWDGTIDYDYD